MPSTWFDDAKAFFFQDLSPDPIAVLPAPCYLYTVRFFPQNPDLVFLAGQNGFIYVYSLGQDHPQLIQELNVGKTIINSICFNLNATVLYATADDGFLYSFPIEQVNLLRSALSEPHVFKPKGLFYV